MCGELGSVDLGQTAPWKRTGQAVGGRKWWVGCHVSTSGGLERAVVNAAAVGKAETASGSTDPHHQVEILMC